MKPIRIATHGSLLAPTRAGWVASRLSTLGHSTETVIVASRGDHDHAPVDEPGRQDLFTKALQEALLDRRADVAVHAYEHLPSAPTTGLEIAAVPERASAHDVLLIRPSAYALDAETLSIRLGARVATGSPRRQRQLLHLRPDLDVRDVRDVRGDVPARIEQLRVGDFDALVLAAAALERLGLTTVELATSDLEVTPLDVRTLVPAPAQGALALEIRRDDVALAQLLTDLHDPPSYRAVAAERGLLAMLQGDGQLELGAHATVTFGVVTLIAWYDGTLVQVDHPSSEGAAMLAYEALGRPDSRLREGP